MVLLTDQNFIYTRESAQGVNTSQYKREGKEIRPNLRTATRRGASELGKGARPAESEIRRRHGQAMHSSASTQCDFSSIT